MDIIKQNQIQREMILHMNCAQDTVIQFGHCYL